MRSPTCLLSFPLAVAAVAACLPAQIPNRIGLSAGLGASSVTRLVAGASTGDFLLHVDDRDYRDWMLDPANVAGTTFALTGLTFIVQDQVGVTTDGFTVVGYGPNPAAPNFPDPAGPWFRTGRVSLPVSTSTGPTAFRFTLTIAPPPRPTGDVWLGCGFGPPAAGAWPSDGLAMQAEVATTATIGRGILGLPVANLSCFVPTSAGLPTGPAIYPPGPLQQLDLDVIANVTGGVSCTRIGAPTGTALVPLGGITDMTSGTNPDTFNFTASLPARADSPGFLVTDVNFPNAPVFLLQAFGPSPAGPVPAISIPLAAAPGTRGNVCIDVTTANLTFAVTDATGRFQHAVPMTPALSATIAALPPFDVWWQAFVVNTAATPAAPFELHGTGCAIQHL